MNFTDRLKHAWNAFMNKDPTKMYNLGPSYSDRPDRHAKTYVGGERTIINAIYNRIAMDVAAISFRHVRLDEDDRFKEFIKSDFDNCLTLSANVDQTGRALIQDIVLSMFDEGYVAVVPTNTDRNPTITDSYKIHSLRTAKILEWYPDSVKLKAYNEDSGKKEEIILPKKMVAIIENPMFTVMNAPNSTARRLVSKMSILDDIDKQIGASKMDLIIQLPYSIKSEARRAQAEARRRDIEDQLMDSKYGIAYVDSTEHITQLNRPLENNMMTQIEYLTNQLYNQLGITAEVFNGTANESVMLNYYNQTIEPICSAIVDEMKRKFLTSTARSQGQSIKFFKDSFKLVPVEKIADIADKFTRNEILSSNELRGIVGYKPVDDPKADQLINSNLNQAKEEEQNSKEFPSDSPKDAEIQKLIEKADGG